MNTIKILLFALCGFLIGILTSAFILWSFDFGRLNWDVRLIILYWAATTSAFGAWIGGEL